MMSRCLVIETSIFEDETLGLVTIGHIITHVLGRLPVTLFQVILYTSNE